METIEEIATDMKMNERQIRNSLYRSKIKLKESLNGRNRYEREIVQGNWRIVDKRR